MTKVTQPTKTKKVTEFKAIEGEGNLVKALESVERRTNSAQEDYQTIALSLILHLGKSGDIRLIRRMLDKFPEALRANSMKRFLETYGQVKFLTEGDILTGKYLDKEGEKLEVGTAIYDSAKPVKLGEAVENKWWKAVKEEAYVPFNLDDRIQNLINLAEHKLKKGVSTAKGDNLNTETLNALKALVRKA